MKNILNKPYTNTQYADFACMANDNGQRCEQDENAVYALYATEILQDSEIVDISKTSEYLAQQLEQLKAEKLQENIEKAKDFEQNGSVEYKDCIFEMSLSNRNNLRDTVEALTIMGQTSTDWNDKNDEIVELTIEDLQTVRLELILGAISNLWLVEYPAKLTEINSATTVEELNAIVIDYEE